MAMVRIEAVRFARYPVFIIGALAAYVLQAVVGHAFTAAPYNHDVLAWMGGPGFFIALPAMVVAARLTGSTDVAAESLGTAPGTEARRTLAMAGACAVPFAAGMLWLAEVFALLAHKGVHPHEWWFATMNDLYVWAILLALGPVACLGGALLVVLCGRWLRFPGAAIVTVIAVTVFDLLGQAPWFNPGHEPTARYRLWVPWAVFHTGTFGNDSAAVRGYPKGSAAILPGNPAWYLLYTLALCALAVGGAVWHDRSARTPRLRLVGWFVVASAVLFLMLAILTGPQQVAVSKPLPWLA